MKKLLCLCLALLLLAGCSAPEPAPTPISEPEGSYTQDIYELTFSAELVSGSSARDWDFTYSHNDEAIASGHRVLLSKEVFTFYSVQVTITEDGNPDNAFSASIPVALCDGGSGKTEITVTASDGRVSTFKIVCTVRQVGKC
ncbi:MAG: hypothetical protein E7453_08635 [Ruminococcaceae bacterium]|nr:hypothetical protein [Oscillospiraceae bacterium]